MKEHVRAAYLKYGFPIPEEHRYTILCRWRPPKELWPTHGRRWRDIAVEVLGEHKPDILADESVSSLLPRIAALHWRIM